MVQASTLSSTGGWCRQYVGRGQAHSVGQSRYFVLQTRYILRYVVVSMRSGPIRRFGWSMVEKRWSYGVSVAGARELNKILREAIGD